MSLGVTVQAAVMAFLHDYNKKTKTLHILCSLSTSQLSLSYKVAFPLSILLFALY